MEIGEAVVKTVIVHQVGNRLREEPLVLADQCFSTTESISNLILSGYLRGIVNDKNLHFLTHESDISLNEIAHHTSSFFSNKITFIELSKRIATHLYSSAHHPNIAAGDLFVILFDRVKLDDKYCSAIGVYKSESKHQYISTKNESGTPELEVVTGINPELIDKGALITEDSSIVYALDRLSNRTKYWIDDFLKAKQVADEKTKSAIAVSLIERVREKIESPSARQDFGQEVMALCSKKDEVLSSEIKQISERYISEGFWDTELEKVTERKGLLEIGEISIPSKKFETRLKKTLSRLDLGKDIILTIPNNLLLDGTDFHVDGKTIRISVVLEEKNG